MYRQMLSSLRKFGTDEVDQQLQRIIEFYGRYGEQATREAFGAERKVISRWRQKLKEREGALEGLMPESTRPKWTRTMIVAVEIVQCIRQISRISWGRCQLNQLGKRTLVTVMLS